MNRGFTLVELMVTVAITAILAAIAVPSFSRMIADNRVTTQANDLLTGISLARSEAVKRGTTVTMRPNGAAGYGTGWCVHLGGDCSGTNIIRSQDGSSNVVLGGDDVASAITFDSFGANASSDDKTITIEPPDCSAGESRQRTLTINAVGSPKIRISPCS